MFRPLAKRCRVTRPIAGTACGRRRRPAPEIIKKLNAETNKALAGDMKDRLGNGLLIEAGSPEDFAKFQKRRYRAIHEDHSDAGIKFE